MSQYFTFTIRLGWRHAIAAGVLSTTSTVWLSVLNGMANSNIDSAREMGLQRAAELLIDKQPYAAIDVLRWVDDTVMANEQWRRQFFIQRMRSAPP